jgi:TetR/AcrR family transcriptional regulator, fatty acid metabolism regulator protein
MTDESFIKRSLLVSPRIVDKDERRGEILGAATRAFARKGYHATRVADIAREAGVAQGTVYLYFGSREEILVSAFEVFADGMMAGVRAAVEADDPALDRLRSVVRAVLSSMEADPDLSRVMLDFWSAGTFGARDPEEGPRIDLGKVYAEYRGLFAGLLEQARREGDVRDDLPEGAPAVIVGAIEGVMLQWIVAPGAPSPLEIAEPMLDVLLNGLRERRTG